MVKRGDLADYLAELLHVHAINDYCPNGLQIEGRATINKIITGVTACQALLDYAVTQQADALLVHHGYFWKGEQAVITGIKRKHLTTLLANDLNLFAYHLPLDVHNEFGNNQQLAKQLGIEPIGQITVDGLPLLSVGKLPAIQSGAEFAALITTALKRAPLHIAAARPIAIVAWCTGAAQDLLEQAAQAGVDAYLTGEVSERTVHIAREHQLHFFAAGHHATERYGIAALGEHLAGKFALQHEFVDIANPV